MYAEKLLFLAKKIKSMEFKTLILEYHNNIAVITMNRPEAMNALSTLVFQELNQAFDQLEAKNDIRALIITGAGKAFVAGADISEMSDKNAEQGAVFSKFGQDTFNRISTLKFPVIGAINGFALGGGCEFAMACDFRIASNFAKFGQPEVNLGLIPGYCGNLRLPKIVGLSNALYLLMTADIIDANEALRLGLVQKVVPAEELMKECMNIAEKIASKGKIAVQKAKEVTINGFEMGFEEACKYEAREFGNLFGNGESGEGMKAFLEKRKPSW
jgi:enoyl-CoA hydratase